jgi:molecular chaperone GrpE
VWDTLERSEQTQDEAKSEEKGLETAEDKVPNPIPITTESSDGLDRLILAFAKEKKNSEDCMSRLKYLQADFENYRKRMDRQMDETKRRTAESIYANLLEVLDELELALENGRTAGGSTALLEGVEMTLKKLKKMLASDGVSEIASVGQAFDPKTHCAISTVLKEDTDEGIVMEELRKGYLINGRVLRPAMVKVSMKKSVSNKNDDIKG